MGVQINTADEISARLAFAEHGVVTRVELLTAGLSPKEIERRLGRGSLLREHRGVYRVGHRAPSTEATYLAAVKAHGPQILLSGRATAYLLRLLRGAPPPAEVTTTGQSRIPGVKSHRVRELDLRDKGSYRGIPITTVPRTLVDLAAILTAEHLARACHQAGVLHGTTPRSSWEQDRQREREARGRGDEFRRFTYADVYEDTRYLLGQLRALLPIPARSGRASPRTSRPR